MAASPITAPVPPGFDPREKMLSDLKVMVDELVKQKSVLEKLRENQMEIREARKEMRTGSPSRSPYVSTATGSPLSELLMSPTSTFS